MPIKQYYCKGISICTINLAQAPTEMDWGVKMSLRQQRYCQGSQ